VAENLSKKAGYLYYFTYEKITLMTNLLLFVWLHLQLVLAGSVIWLFVYDACNCTTFADTFLQILLVS